MGFGKKLRKTVKAVATVARKIETAARPLVKVTSGFVPGGSAILQVANLGKSLVAKPVAKVQEVAQEATALYNDVSNDLKTIASAGAVGNTGVPLNAYIDAPLAVPGPRDSENTKIPLNSERPVKLRKQGNNTVMYVGIGALALIGIFVIARRK